MKNISIEKTEVRSSLEVWDFMQDRQSDRHSKLQAYCSLLNKAAVRYVPNSVPKGSIPKLKEYQFVTTILGARRRMALASSHSKKFLRQYNGNLCQFHILC